MTDSTRSRRALAVGLSIACLAGMPGTGAAQEAHHPADSTPPAGVAWLPGSSTFAPLLADPTQSAIRGSLVLADRPDLERMPPPDAEGGSPGGSDFEGRNLEAEVALGFRLPVVRLRAETAAGPSVFVGFETGILNRFYVATGEQKLIHTDFRVGLPISLGYRAWETRLELRHVSSHFGDEYLREFRPADTQVGLDGFELLVGRRFADVVRAYVGGEWNYRVIEREVTERTALRLGLEYDPGGLVPSRTLWGYGAAELRRGDLADRLAGTAVAGLAIRARGLVARLEAWGHFGPSPIAQLRRYDETYWGVGIRFTP